MSDAVGVPPTRPGELPPYRAVLAVDMKDFSGTKAATHHELTEAIPLVLERSFLRGGHRELWEARCFPQGRGDGYVVGFRPEVLPTLLDPFLQHLQEELEYHHRLSPTGPMRMRVSISVGPLADSDEGRLGDGSGAAMVETHRLLDADPVRNLLEKSDPAVTFVAAIISARVYEDVVAAGYTTRAPSEFAPAPVRVKKYQGTAYLHVPKPSGRLLTDGFAETPEGEDGEDSTDAPPDATARSGHTNVISGGTVQSAVQLRDHQGDLVIGDNHPK